MTVHGEEEITMNFDLIEDMQSMHKIDVFHEIILTAMIDLADKAGLECRHGC